MKKKRIGEEELSRWRFWWWKHARIPPKQEMIKLKWSLKHPSI